MAYMAAIALFTLAFIWLAVRIDSNPKKEKK